MRRLLAAMTVVSLLGLATASCGGDDDKGGDSGSSGGSIAGVQVSGEFGKEPTVKVDAPLKVDKSESQVITEGDGDRVVEGSPASLHLLVVNGRTGKKAIGTYDQGTPVTAPMAQGSVFPSVFDAVVGKPAGTRVAVASTPQDAFGAKGAPQYGIGAKDSVVFVVDIMSVPLTGPEGTEQELPGGLPTINQDGQGNVTGFSFDKAPAKPSGKLQVVPVIEGDGPAVKPGASVTFDYLGQVYGTDNVFDESYSQAPRTFSVGTGSLIKAWDQGLVGVKQGSRVMIIAPPEYGYGKAGNPQAKIKGTDTLVFVVDVLGVS